MDDYTPHQRDLQRENYTRNYYGSGVNRSGVVRRRDGSPYDAAGESANRVHASYGKDGFGYSSDGHAAGGQQRGAYGGQGQGYVSEAQRHASPSQRTSGAYAREGGYRYGADDGRYASQGRARRDAVPDRYSARSGRSASGRGGYGARDARGGGGGRRGGGVALGKKPLIVGIVAVVLVVAVIYYFTNLAHIDIVVNGSEVSVAKNTTYGKLRDMNLVAEDPGDFVAVDGSVIEAGKGNPTKLFDNGVEVEDYGARVSEASVITQARGDDIMEEYDASQTVVPVTFQVNDGTFNFYQGCLHTIVSPGKDGVSESRVGKTSGISVADEVIEPMQPKLFKSIDPEISDTSDKVIALTFDDGPAPTYTQQALDMCAQFGIKATFFMLGTQVEEYPEVAKTVADAGHQVASHTYSHESSDYLNKLDDEGVRQQLSKAQEAIANATGVTTTTVRPPGGNINYDNVIAGQQYFTTLAGWTIDSEDWKKPGADAIAQTILAGAANGSIILCHDGGGDRSQTIAGLTQAIPQLLEQGYRFVTIDELAALRVAAENSGAAKDGAQ